MIITEKKVKLFFDRQKNTLPFKIWYKKQEKIVKDILLSRLERISNGNYGDYKSVGNNILEIQTRIQNILYRDKQYYCSSILWRR